MRGKKEEEAPRRQAQLLHVARVDGMVLMSPEVLDNRTIETAVIDSSLELVAEPAIEFSGPDERPRTKLRDDLPHSQPLPFPALSTSMRNFIANGHLLSSPHRMS